jgi:hypothetical protein
LVCEEFEIPFLRYKNKENEIWYLPSIQRLFTSDFAPIVIPPRQLFPITQVRLYERYAKNSSGISIRTRAILSQIEAETRSQHEVKRVDDFVSEIAFFDSK